MYKAFGIFILVFFAVGTFSAQNETTRGVKPESPIPTDTLQQKDSSELKLELSLMPALIYNRAFSNYPTAQQLHNSNTTKISPSGNAGEIMPGFSFGIEFSFGYNILRPYIGLSGAYTLARYHYSEINQLKYPSTYETFENKTEYDVNLNSVMINYEGGVKLQAFKNFSARLSLLVNQNVRRIETANGQNTITQWSENPDPKAINFNIAETKDINFTQENWDPAVNISARLGLEYNFDLRSKRIGVFAFRNFGFTTALPWWGIGFSYYLIK